MCERPNKGLFNKKSGCSFYNSEGYIVLYPGPFVQDQYLDREVGMLVSF